MGTSCPSSLQNNLPPVDVAICRPSVGGKIEWRDFAIKPASPRRSSGLIIEALILALEVIHIGLKFGKHYPLVLPPLHPICRLG